MSNIPSLATPADAPETVDEDCDARDAWADGWNACLRALETEASIEDLERRMVSGDPLEPTGALAAATSPEYVARSLQGWSVKVQEDDTQSWLEVRGPCGEGAAFACPRGSVRAQVLQEFAIAKMGDDQTNE